MTVEFAITNKVVDVPLTVPLFYTRYNIISDWKLTKIVDTVINFINANDISYKYEKFVFKCKTIFENKFLKFRINIFNNSKKIDNTHMIELANLSSNVSAFNNIYNLFCECFNITNDPVVMIDVNDIMVDVSETNELKDTYDNTINTIISVANDANISDFHSELIISISKKNMILQKLCKNKKFVNFLFFLLNTKNKELLHAVLGICNYLFKNNPSHFDKYKDKLNKLYLTKLLIPTKKLVKDNMTILSDRYAITNNECIIT